MARSKKTKSAPNNASKNLLKAIKKHRSASEVQKMKSTKTTTPVSIPSPEKVKKKAITKKLQNELSRKRKRVEEPVKVKKEGLRLLKRGPVSMHRIVRRKIQGIKLVVNFNSKGVPYGKASTEMQSYIGVLARTKVPISLKSWKEVSTETKKKIWNCVQIAFDVPPEAKQVILKSAGNKWREYVIDVDVDGYPAELKQLWLWASETLKDGRAHSFQLCKDAFGSTTKHVIFLSDIHALCGGGEISGSTICYYINILGGFLKRHKMTEMVSFVDPILFGGSGCGTPVDRSRAISARFKNAKAGQYFLLPLHHQNHWTLTAVNPEAHVVFHMDPLKRRIADEEWIEVVDNAINMYKDNAKKYKKKKIMWENLAGVPVQSGTTDCGLYVMRYMREICFDKERQFATKWLKRSNLTYDITELNETRVSWAKYFMKKEVHQ